MSSRREFDWEDLLLSIEDGRVIPVVGPDLLTIDVDGEERPLYSHLAVKLAEELKVSSDDLPADFGLNDVALVYAKRERNSRRIYSRLRGIIEGLDDHVPESLRKLADITHFKLYLSTTVDSLLRKALDEARFGGNDKTHALAYSPYLKVSDIPSEIQDLDYPVVYQLFGPLTSSTDYALTEEDVLEFLHALQSPERRPKLLFDELKTNHILVLGCGYPDWLARFFARTVRNERLSSHALAEVVVDDRTPSDQALTMFFEHCAVDVFFEGGARAFVDQLHERWTERHGDGSAEAVPEVVDGDQERMIPEAVFLSYAKEDREAVAKLKGALESVGLDVWFDQRELQSGDNWERELQRNIKTCSLFLPMISGHSTSRIEGTFRKEWRWAVSRAEGMDERFPFVHPVVIDETNPEGQGIPDFFLSRQWQTAPEGEAPQDFLDRVRELVRECRKRKAGLV